MSRRSDLEGRMRSSLWSLARLALLGTLLLFSATLGAQTQYPLGGNGWMGLGNRNGDFFIEQDDLSVKVPGGYLRINRDYDGRQWTFNRQWSGLARPSYNEQDYPSIGTFIRCTSIDGVSTCDGTASAGGVQRSFDIALGLKARIPNDPGFGRNVDGTPLANAYGHEFVARKGIGFTRGSDGTSWVNSEYPRFVVRPMSVPSLPASTGPDAHPVAGKPGAGGVSTTLVDGFRWIDRSGQWIEYDRFGRITSYGDRNNVRVWFQHGTHGQVERVLDDNGRTVFTLLYTAGGDAIREVRDHTPATGGVRSVRYDYDSLGRLRHVIDARGNTTSFEYGGTADPADDYGLSTRVGEGSADDGSRVIQSVDLRSKIRKVIDAAGRTTEIGYGVTQRVARITAPDGGETRFDYGYDKLKKEFSLTVRYPQTAAGQRIETVRFDQEGRPVAREVNGKTVMSATGDGRSLTFVDERNGSTKVQRDTFDEVTRITFSDGSSRSYVYEAGSTDVREYTDEAGTVWRYRWDGRGNLLEKRAAVGKPEEQVTEYVYNGRGELELLRRKGGANPDGSSDTDVEVRYTRDDHGNIASMLDGEGYRWQYQHDNQGNVVEALNPLSREWRYDYDAHGNLVAETDPNQHAVSYVYDPTDRQTSATDGRGKTTQFGYDAAGRDASITNPYGHAFLDQYDQAGRLISRSDAVGQSSMLSYDSLGRLTKVVDGEQHQTLLDYAETDGTDRGGRQAGKIAYPTFQRLMRFDDRKRPTQQTDLLPDDSATIGATYDTRGLLRTMTGADGHTQSYEYDALGRTVAVINALGETTRLGYDHRDNLISVTDGKNRVSRMAYDGRGLLTSETNPLGQATRYVYDEAGNLSEVQRPNGTKIVSQYDPAGRLQQQRGYRANGSLEQTHAFEWDTADNLISWSTDRASASLAYDDADRLLSESVTVDGVTLARAYTWYPNDQIKTYTGPDGITLTYSYDGNGQLERVDIPGEGSISATEWSWLVPKKIVLPGGTVQEMDRDGLMGLTRLRVKSPSQTLLFELENRFGKLRELTERSTDGKLTRFDYDEAVRLVESDPAFAGGSSETYTIDAAGNREQHSLVNGTWEYDAANRLLRRGDLTYDYDSAGNLSRRVDARLSEPLRTTRYTYDAFNRLIEVRDGAEAVIATYAYDPYDQRLVKEVAQSRNGATVGKTLYLQGEEGLLAEADASGSVVRSYGWHPEGEYSTAPLFQRAGGVYFYYHTDHLGTPWRVTNRDGAVVWSASDYSAFGQAKVVAGAQVVQPWRLPGQYLDVETGLHYNLRRYYEPETGRYISEDPLGFASDANFYAYANHSPTNYADPRGEILPAVGAAARWVAWRYGACLLECMAVDAAIDLIRNPCNIDVSDCLKECLWSLVPIKLPCKFKGMLGSAVGAAAGSGLFNSFPGNTEVATPDGLKRIADLRPGDKVLAYAEWKDETQVEEVTDLILSHHEQTIVTLTLESGETLEVTGGHPLHTPTGWRAAQLLVAGGKVYIRRTGGHLIPSDITKVEIRKEIVPVYNLEVSGAHTFFVGKDGVLAHNARSGTSGNNSHAQGGKDFHNPAKNPYPSGFRPEEDIPGAGRADAFNPSTKEVIERKYSSRDATRRRGVKQLKRYCDAIGPDAKGYLEMMDPVTGVKTIKQVVGPGI